MLQCHHLLIEQQDLHLLNYRLPPEQLHSFVMDPEFESEQPSNLVNTHLHQTHVLENFLHLIQFLYMERIQLFE